MHAMHGKTMIVLLSGGLDSMVCAGLAREAGARIVALTIDYNQRHRVELESAARIADFVGAAEHIVLPLDLRRFGGSALTADIAVPKDGVGDEVPRSEEHTSELQSLMRIPYAVFCLKHKTNKTTN